MAPVQKLPKSVGYAEKSSIWKSECKVDASGLPVHESCYIMKVKLVTEQQLSGKRKRSA